MNSFKDNLLQKSINNVPVVLVLKNGTPSIQKMDIEKWNDLSLDRQQKIRNYAKKRNESILSSIDKTSYLESINSMLYDTSESVVEKENVDSVVSKENNALSALSESRRSESRRSDGNDKVVESAENSVGSQREQREQGAGTESSIFEDNNDIDLTPNFVNTFFTYVNQLVKEYDPNKPEEKKEEPVEMKKVEEKPIDLPDYSDPAKCQSDSELPPGWTAHVSTSSRPGETYYFNESTGESQWEKPESTENKETPAEKTETGEEIGKPPPLEKTETSEETGKTETVETPDQKKVQDELPPGWKRHISENSDPGKEYWYNEETGETRWDKPKPAAPSSDWTCHTSESSDPGKVYYYNEKTGVTQWDKPEGFVETKKEETVHQEEWKCHECGQEGGLKLFSYLIEGNIAKKVRFCCFKCFEKKEF
jgi:hypothetical protein